MTTERKWARVSSLCESRVRTATDRMEKFCEKLKGNPSHTLTWETGPLFRAVAELEVYRHLELLAQHDDFDLPAYRLETGKEILRAIQHSSLSSSDYEYLLNRARLAVKAELVELLRSI